MTMMCCNYELSLRLNCKLPLITILYLFKNCTSAIAHCMQVRYIVLSSMNAASLWEYRSGGAEEWLVLQKTKLLKKRPIFCRVP